MIEYPGQRPLAGGTRQRGRRIVGTHALVLEEGVETAQRGRLARDRGALQRHPGLGELPQLLRRRIGEPAAEQLRGAPQIALVGEQGVARRAGFGGHHLEEGRDSLPILARGVHSRATASAAIIRAS